MVESEPKWSSLTDTGSMQPSAEALDWQRRADAWAQQAESEDHRAVEPANRWSEVAATGRPTFPADGVGWRTETAEWRATGARWRQTTEWRSTTGSHGWRSTTEAWQTGGSSSYPTPAETPMAQPAISSTAWQSPAEEPATPADDGRPAWQQFAGSSSSTWQQPEPPQSRDNTWQQPETGTPSWRRPEPPATPARQQPAPRTPAESSPSWQQLVDPVAPPSSTAPETPSWRRGAIEGTATWTDPADNRSTPEPPAPGRQRSEPQPEAPSWQRSEAQPEAPSWQRSEAPGWQRSETPGWQRSEAPTWQGGETPGRQRPETAGPQRAEPPSWQTSQAPGWQGNSPAPGRPDPETPSWQSAEPPSWQARRDDGRHLVREDDRAAWRRDTTDPAESSPRVGRRRAPEGGTGWTTRSDTDDWAGYTDTGSIPLYRDPATPPAPSWRGARTDGPTAYGEPTGRRALPATPHDEPGYQIPPATPYETGRRSRPEGVTGAPALPPGRADEAPRGRRYADEPTTDEPPTGYPTGRRAARYADEEPGQGYPPRRAAGQSAAMPLGTRPDDTSTGRRPDDTSTGRRPEDTRAGRRRRAAEPEGDVRGAAAAMPIEPRTSPEALGRRGMPTGAPPTGAPRTGAPPIAGPPTGVPPTGAPPTGAPPTGAPKGRARYNPGRNDWREQTGSWEAEPDTSSWTRDPDTGQWSRAEDDPRVLAWRREAARREEMERRGGQRALPAAPTSSSWNRGRDGETGAPAEPIADDRRDDDPGRGGGPRGGAPTGAPRSGAAYGSGPPVAPRSATPYGGPAGADPYGAPTGAPDAGTPYGGGPANAGRSGTAYGGGPISDAGPASAPRSGTAYGAGPTSAPRSGTAYGGGPISDGGPASAPRSGTAYGAGTYGTAPTSANPSSGHGYGGTVPAGDNPYDPRGGTYGTAPAGPPRYTGSAPASGVPYGGAPTGAPRSAVPYGAADDSYRSGRRRPADEGGWRATADPVAPEQPGLSPEAWRAEPEPRHSRQARRLGFEEDAPPAWTGRAEPAVDPGPPAEPEWQRRERAERARGSATYRGGGHEDWRHDLADQSNLAEGESRRFGTSDFIPFRSSGAAAVPRSSNLSMTSTSLISPMPREQREATARPQQRSSNGIQGLTGSYERRAVTGGYPTVRRGDLLDPDDEEDEQESGGPLAAVGYTVIWYGVPVVLFILYMLVANTGGSQAQALNTLAKAAPQFGISLVLSIVVAVGLRFVSHSWKAISVGLAAAVVGGGLATVLTSAITGNSLS